MFDTIEPVKVITIKKEQEHVKVSYPKIVNMKDKQVEQAINHKIRELVMYLEEEGNLPDTTVDIRYTDKVNRNGVYSVVFVLFYYTEHAAHPMEIQKALTFSTLTGKCYSFSDLFQPNSYYKTRLTRYVKGFVKDENIQLIHEIQPVSDEQEFYLTNDSLVLFYQLYTYTPYVYGFLEVPIPLNDVRSMSTIDSPIRQLTSR
ncbi:DUF3298 and DUF4163 domain-containing protein [Pseudalkalibacillus sp. SCS-8]|uniref:DUF3298 and DUF4163 domain-containing protein n=1 Tax=Pseudalkalibacillus nanhaiensis TaxID=3115291 RepID=UPI0032DADE19